MPFLHVGWGRSDQAIFMGIWGCVVKGWVNRKESFRRLFLDNITLLTLSEQEKVVDSEKKVL